ncbi:MAG: hypothetical protein VB101_05795 [Rhodospirillaceae bacterium]|nr:hypothetical protein [Rhodospirillaceae bacterium]MEA4837778.1 hypothetical protein [Rhodospirillaceae bacterium]
MKPNYRFDRTERTRSKEAKKIEKREAQAARRKAGRADSAPMEEDADGASTALAEDHDVSEHASEKED